MRTPARARFDLGAQSGKCPGVRSATGCFSSGMATRSATSLFTSLGPGATLDQSTSIPLRVKSLRHSRTVSSRTPKASAIRALN